MTVFDCARKAFGVMPGRHFSYFHALHAHSTPSLHTQCASARKKNVRLAGRSASRRMK